MIYLLSPRRGGPYHQLKLIAAKLSERGYSTKHCYQAREWTKLHFNSYDTIISVIPFFFLRNKKKFILNIRGNYHREKRLDNPLSHLYNRNIKFADKVVLPSQYLKKELSLKTATIIPNSTNINILAPTALAPRSSAVRIATITNFDFRPKAQGISKLINIVNQINTSQSVELHIYGGGQWLNFARQQYELHNFKKYPVFFHGQFASAARILTGNHVFIYWSIFDNMPNVLTEAIACGLPVVANDYGAYKEILGPNNLLATNEQQFSQYLLNLIEDPAHRLVFSQKNLVRSRLFDINKNIKHWIELIES
jgi:glycosyltransferase involved in cell wall biosynthesis